MGERRNKRKKEKKEKEGEEGNVVKQYLKKKMAKSFQNDERHTFTNSRRPEDTKKINAKKLTLHTSQSNCNLKDREKEGERKC